MDVAARTIDAELPAPAVPVEAPPRWRLICVSAAEPRWTPLAVQLAEAGLPQPRIEWVDSALLLMQSLRHERYDAIVIEHSTPPSPAKPGVRDAGTTLRSTIDTRQLISGLRGGGHLEAVVVLITAPADDLLAMLAEHDAEALVSLSPWDSPALLPTIRRAVRTAELRRSHRELQLKHERRLARDREEAAAMLLRQQEHLSNLMHGPEMFESIRVSYEQFLRTRLTSDSAPPDDDLAQLAAALIAADLPPQQVLALHAGAVQRLIAVMDEPSAQHLVSLADRLALDLMTRLAETRHDASSSSSSNFGGFA